MLCLQLMWGSFVVDAGCATDCPTPCWLLVRLPPRSLEHTACCYMSWAAVPKLRARVPLRNLGRTIFCEVSNTKEPSTFWLACGHTEPQYHVLEML